MAGRLPGGAGGDTWAKFSNAGITRLMSLPKVLFIEPGKATPLSRVERENFKVVGEKPLSEALA